MQTGDPRKTLLESAHLSLYSSCVLLTHRKRRHDDELLKPSVLTLVCAEIQQLYGVDEVKAVKVTLKKSSYFSQDAR